MRTFAAKPKTTQPTTSAKESSIRRVQVGGHDPNSIINLQRTIGNQAAQRLLQAHDIEALNAGMTSTPSPHDFSRVPIQPRSAGALQAKLQINKPGDQY